MDPRHLFGGAALPRSLRELHRPIGAELIGDRAGAFHKFPTQILQQRNRPIDRFRCVSENRVLPGVTFLNPRLLELGAVGVDPVDARSPRIVRAMGKSP